MIRVGIVFGAIMGTLLTTSCSGIARGTEPAPPVKLVIHPAPQPVPALRYRLLPGRLDQRPGNAAVHYGKVTAEETRFFGNREILDEVQEMLERPLDKLRADDAPMPGGGPDGGVQDDIRRGAHCRYCDWQLPIAEVPFYGMPLPEIQQTREFARILGACARLQIADGEFAEAVESLQCGYSLGRHVAAGETLLNGLVGIAICQIMSQQVFEFVQQPKAPNLYWALSSLPTPLIDVNDAIDVEAMGFELSFPELRDVQTATRTPAEWRELFHRVARDFIEQASRKESPQPLSPDELDRRCEQLLPAAKESLVAAGLPAATVDAMPLHQVALLYSLQTYHRLLDDAIKYYYLPFPNATVGIDNALLAAERDQQEILPIAESLMPAIKVTREAMARNDRYIAVLRVIEALRIYGASHEGQLPAHLEEITEVPIPTDPVTGLPFDYRLDGDTALLTAPTLRDWPVNYEISMVRP